MAFGITVPEFAGKYSMFDYTRITDENLPLARACPHTVVNVLHPVANKSLVEEADIVYSLSRDINAYET